MNCPCGYKGEPAVAGRGDGSHWAACPRCGQAEGQTWSLAAAKSNIDICTRNPYGRSILTAALQVVEAARAIEEASGRATFAQVLPLEAMQEGMRLRDALLAALAEWGE